MNTSAIEWTDRTWNPVSGCSHVSEGCRHCYAERFFPRVYGKDREVVPTPADGIIPENYIAPKSVVGHWTKARKFTDVQCHPERLDQPLKIKKPQKIFVNSMSDLFHEDVPDHFILAVYMTMARATHHAFQLLTKRPERMYRFLKKLHDDGLTMREGCGVVLPNVWLGVSVEDQKTADERIPLLLQTPAAVRWISAEPLLGPIDFEFNEMEIALEPDGEGTTAIQGKIDWVVVGGESGPRARTMEISWANAIKEQCAWANVSFFMKQLSQNILPRGFKDLENFPEYLRMREFPKTP